MFHAQKNYDANFVRTNENIHKASWVDTRPTYSKTSHTWKHDINKPLWNSLSFQQLFQKYD